MHKPLTTREVAAFYDATSDLWVEYLGTTLQAGILSVGGDPVHLRAHNRMLALRAGIRDGDRVLDAGCGVCGPAIDVASHLPGVQITAINVSRRQAITGRDLVAAAGLGDRIDVAVADFHALPFADASFDLVQFLESSSHAVDPARAFREAQRVLRPGGRLYLKDGFLRPGAGPREAAFNLAMDSAFRMNTRSLDDTLALLRASGFEVVHCAEITQAVNASYFLRGMLSDPAAADSPRTPLAERLYAGHQAIEPLNWPLVADVAAVRAM